MFRLSWTNTAYGLRAKLENYGESYRRFQPAPHPFTQNIRSDHLMVIAFNPDKTSSAALLAKARSAGYTAQLIGG